MILVHTTLRFYNRWFYTLDIKGKLYNSKLRSPWVEIQADLQRVYEKDALKLRTDCKWVQHFKDGWDSTENDTKVDSVAVYLLLERLDVNCYNNKHSFC